MKKWFDKIFEDAGIGDEHRRRVLGKIAWFQTKNNLTSEEIRIISSGGNDEKYQIRIEYYSEKELV